MVADDVEWWDVVVSLPEVNLPGWFRRRRAGVGRPIGDSRKQVLVVTNYFSPHIGGIEEVVLRQADSLAARGYAVTIVTCRPGPDVPLDEVIGGGIQVVRLRAVNFLDRRYGLPYPLVSPLALFRLVRAAKRSDLVHIHDVFYPLCIMGALAAFLARRPTYVTQHVAIVDHPNRIVMWVQLTIYGTAGRLILRRCSRAIAYNRHVEAHLLGLGVEPGRVIRTTNGIDVDKFSPAARDGRAQLRRRWGFDPDVPLVLFVGRLVPKKGFDLLLRSRPGQRCLKVIVGGGEVSPSLSDSVDTVFLGSRSQSELRDLYRVCDVFVFPAVSEVFTLVMQEAMASGLPVITTADVAYREAGLSDKYVRLIARSAEEVGAAIDEVLSSDIRRAEMAAYSRCYALTHFSWQANFEKEAHAYVELLGC